ncbi:hypothetical protein SAMN06265348_104379 [Pedobacter westerhofensis]|uniref:Uncharacterized protein n=1 Tax=Pedobacter westerhofensis TaxID=425512 RepID=A0A521CZZ9_9SPHI|nr:hypothetical protein [Pedobacter westerhofensis]SMO65025.1 hypothetical protein SAMN06265348_104379 [Pedobacter westerhofensis]
MPANKKYLTKSPFQKFLKITAGFLGGYCVMISFHYLLGYIFEPKNVIITAAFTGYTLWAILMLLAFLSKSAWKIWLYYILLTALFSIPFLLKL